MRKHKISLTRQHFATVVPGGIYIKSNYIPSKPATQQPLAR
jgi:hypothetical protein